uniref:Uncharacterized protein n=1 Tax=viral metagenome TaxID=1070528 RepID=A0A6H1ZU54_9ZZZZ
MSRQILLLRNDRESKTWYLVLWVPERSLERELLSYWYTFDTKSDDAKEIMVNEAMSWLEIMHDVPRLEVVDAWNKLTPDGETNR